MIHKIRLVFVNESKLLLNTMANNDSEKIKDLIEKSFTSVKDIVEVIAHKVDQMETFLHVTMEQVRTIKDQQSVMNKKLDGIEERLDGHGAALVRIESTLKGYGDMYKMNNSNAKKLEKRVEVLEDNAGVQPPPELVLSEVS